MTDLSVAILEILLWGFVATSLMSAVMYGSQSLGLSRLSLPFLLGSWITGDRRAANVAGLILYMVGGWLFAFLYFFIFASIGFAGFGLGALLGAIHGLLLLVVGLPLLPHVHPRVASEYDGPDERRRLEPPGFLALHYGYRTPLVTIAAHALYGGVLGALLPI